MEKRLTRKLPPIAKISTHKSGRSPNSQILYMLLNLSLWYTQCSSPLCVCACQTLCLTFLLSTCPACESEISAAVTETKAAQMRLASAQSELQEKEGVCRDTGHSYSKDKSKFDALHKEIAKIEVYICILILIPYPLLTLKKNVQM